MREARNIRISSCRMKDDRQWKILNAGSVEILPVFCKEFGIKRMTGGYRYVTNSLSKVFHLPKGKEVVG